ncbi:MAG: hypothetical protein IT426_10590 [Pirellulales bacterium]|nr:hypothetical protein [Pirellulales bacterium]
MDQSERNLRIAELLQQWLAEDANDDQTDWPVLEQELLDSTMRCHEPEDKDFA